MTRRRGTGRRPAVRWADRGRARRRPAGAGALAAALALCCAAPVSAAWDVVVHAGVFDVSRDHEALEAGFEMRLPLDAWGLEAATGLSATADSALWAWGGLRRDFSIGKRWLVAPGVAVALFEDGDGKDLGGAVLFQSSLSASYLLTRGVRLGLAYTHLSNAGLYDLNPGANSVLLTLRVPVDR